MKTFSYIIILRKNLPNWLNTISVRLDKVIFPPLPSHINPTTFIVQDAIMYGSFTNTGLLKTQQEEHIHVRQKAILITMRH